MVVNGDFGGEVSFARCVGLFCGDLFTSLWNETFGQ